MFSLDIYAIHTKQHNTDSVKRNRGRMTSNLEMSTPDFSQKCVLKCGKQCYCVVYNVV